MHPYDNSLPEGCDMHRETERLPGKVNSTTPTQIMYRKEERQGSSLSFNSPSVLAVGIKSCVVAVYLVFR